MRIYIKNIEKEGKDVHNEICIDFESEVDKTTFGLLTEQLLQYGTHVAVSSLINNSGQTMIGFRPIDKGDCGANRDVVGDRACKS